MDRRTRLTGRLVYAVLMVPCVAAHTHAYDFMERPRSMLFGTVSESPTIAADGYAQSAYRDNAFLNTDLDQFQVEAFVHHALLDAARTRTSVYYATYMLNGPVTEGRQPGAEASQWIMNAIQYEYGIQTAWYAFPRRPRAAVIAEYSRRSYHPLRGGLEDPAADLLRVGWAMLDIPLFSARFARHPAPRLDAMIRASWSELYDFWGAPRIPDPRALFTLHLAAELRMDTPLPGVSGFALAMPDVILLRAGGFAVDAAIQSGLRFGAGLGRIELYLDFYHSGDTEQLIEERAPATLFGYAVRFVLTP